MICPICGQDFRDCRHDLADVDRQNSSDALEEAIDKRLIELGVVEKSHTKIMQSAKVRAEHRRKSF